MRTIAELIMRGRMQAGAVALLGTFLPFITPAVIALVTLRKGAFEGTIILFVGLLPTILTFGANQSQSLFFLSTVFSLIVVYISALVLRQTVSWPLTVMALLLINVVTLLLIMQLVPNYLIDSFNGALQEQAAAAGIKDLPVASNETLLAGALALAIMLNGVCSLFLSRWWQSLLYNPGGFRSEFRQFKPGSIAAVIYLTISLYFFVQGDAYFAWSFIFALPLMLASIAIVHTLANSLKNARQVLIIFYVTLVILVVSGLTNYVQIVLMAAGFLDNWLNFRSRGARPS